LSTEAVTYFDFVNKRERDDFKRAGVDVEILDLFAQKIMYEVIANRCTKKDENATMENLWGWVAASKHMGDCHAIIDSKLGSLWHADEKDRSLDLCASDDNVTPYWLREIRGADNTTVIFQTFIPGVPMSSVFVPPSDCPK